MSNTEPLVVEKYAGRGRVIVQAIPLRLQWSQLARSQAFVVMVHDWLAYLTQPRATRHNLHPGDPIAVHVPASETRDTTLQTPHGDAIELTADVMGDGHLFRTSRTILPGDYVLELGAAGDRIPFHVNRDPNEFNLAALTATEQQQIADIAVAGSTVESSGTVMSADHEPLWPLLFAALIALIAGELILSGMIARERFGSDPIAETTEHAGSLSFTSTGPAPLLRPTVNAESVSRSNEYVSAERV